MINEIDVADDSIAAEANVFRVTAFINRLDPRSQSEETQKKKTCCTYPSEIA